MDSIPQGLLFLQTILLLVSLSAIPLVRRGQQVLIPLLWVGPLAILFPAFLYVLGTSSVSFVLVSSAVCLALAVLSARMIETGTGRVEDRILEWNRRDAIHILVLVGVSLILFRHPLFTGGTLDSSEDIAQSLPYAAFYARSLLSGEIPLWNPYNLCGTPFVANIQSAVFYPGNLLYLLFPVGYGFAVDLWLHILGLGIGVYLLARVVGCGRSGALIAAASFMLSGFPVARVFASHKNLLNTLAWMPWVLAAGVAAYRRPRIRYICLLAAGGGLQILAGYPQLVQYTWLLMVAVPVIDLPSVIRKRKLVRDYVRRIGVLGLSLVGAVCIAAVQLLPTAELLPLSNRAEGVPLGAALHGAPFVQTVSNYVFPLLFGLPRQGTYFGAFNYMELASYVGLVALGLALFSLGRLRERKTAVLSLGILLAFLLVLGDRTPLIRAMCAIIPGAKNLQGPFRWNVAVALGICLLAGLSWSSFVSRAAKIPNLRIRIAKTAGPILIALAVPIYLCSLDSLPIKPMLKEKGEEVLHTLYYEHNRGTAKPFEEHVARLDTVISHGISHTAAQIFLLGILVSVLSLCLRGRIRPMRLFPLLILLLAMDLLHKHERFVGSEERETYFPKTEHVEFLAREAVHSRFMHLDRTFSYNGAQLFGIRSCNGYDSLLPRSITKLYADQQGEKVHGRMNKIHFDNPSGKIPDMLGIDYVLCARELPDQDWTLVDEKRERTYVRRNYRDFQFLESALVRLYCRKQRINRVWVEEAWEDAGKQPAIVLPDLSGDRVAFLSDGINEVNLAVDSASGGLLVLCDTDYPGWRAYVNGEETSILTVNGFARGVVVPSGKSEVRFCFQPVSYPLGLFISEFAVGTILFFGLTSRRKSRQCRENRPYGCKNEKRPAGNAVGKPHG